MAWSLFFPIKCDLYLQIIFQICAPSNLSMFIGYMQNIISWLCFTPRCKVTFSGRIFLPKLVPTLKKQKLYLQKFLHRHLRISLIYLYKNKITNMSHDQSVAISILPTYWSGIIQLTSITYQCKVRITKSTVQCTCNILV